MMANKITWEAVSVTHIGKRENYEDNFLMNGFFLSLASQKEMENKNVLIHSVSNLPPITLLAIADGMGGHLGGEVASTLCMERLAQSTLKLQHSPFSQLEDGIEFLKKEINKINQNISSLGKENAQLTGMGSTLLIFLIVHDEWAILNIGDCRAYFFKDETLLQLSKDHTEGQRLLDLGLLTLEELNHFSARKSLNRYVGYYRLGYNLEADIISIKVREGIWILCSDGVYDNLSHSEITNIMSSNDTLENAGKELVEKAISHPNADNTTVLLIKRRCYYGEY